MHHFDSLKIKSVRKETRDAVAVEFEVPSHLAMRFRYVQGQHLTLRALIGGTEIRRTYSICAAVQDEVLRIAIKKVQDGIFSTWANDHLKAGETIEVAPPHGSFHSPLRPENRKHYLGFAAGSGITPLLSILKTTLLTEPHSRFTLVYGNRATSTVMFKEELEDLKDRYLDRLNLVFIMSREQQDIDLFNGRIDRGKCDRLFASWIDPAKVDIAFICGPEPMRSAVSAALETHGLAKAQIKFELFAAEHGSEPRLPHRMETIEKPHCEVRVIMDGRERSFVIDGIKETVLDAALRQGLDLPFSCKGGVCSTCRAKLISGEVDMDVNFALEDYEVARGFILTCQAYPATGRLLIDYDDVT